MPGNAGAARRVIHRGMNTAYFCSLPERLIRAAAALVGGGLYVALDHGLPAAVRRTRLYQSTVDRLLRIVVEWIGGVRGVLPPDPLDARTLAARKAIGNVFEAASVVRVGWSPLWLLAALADATGGTRVYLRALVGELKHDGILAPDAEVASVHALLDDLEATSGLLADTIDVPPLSVAELRQTIDELRRSAAALPGRGRVAAILSEIDLGARSNGRSLIDNAPRIADSARRAGLQMTDAYILEHYRAVLRAVDAEGPQAFAARTIGPYARRAADHLKPATATYTEAAIDRLKGRRPAPHPPAVTSGDRRT